jgi:hypothetical protein
MTTAVETPVVKKEQPIKVKKYATIALNYDWDKLTRIENKQLRSHSVRLGIVFKRVNDIVVSDVNRLLTRPQEEYLLPRTRLDISAKNERFDAAVNEFYANYEVELNDTLFSRKLDITVTEKKYTDISGVEHIIEVPDNLDDYLIYKCALQSPNVAKTNEELLNKDNFQVLLTVQEQEKQKVKSIRELKEKAHNLYLNLTSEINSAQVDWIIESNKSIEDVINDAEDKKNFLFTLQNINPIEFIKIAEDKDIEYKALIRELTHFQVIALLDGIYSYDTTTFGDISQTIGFFKNPDNQLVQALKAKLKNIKAGLTKNTTT